MIVDINQKDNELFASNNTDDAWKIRGKNLGWGVILYNIIMYSFAYDFILVY